MNNKTFFTQPTFSNKVDTRLIVNVVVARICWKRTNQRTDCKLTRLTHHFPASEWHQLYRRVEVPTEPMFKTHCTLTEVWTCCCAFPRCFAEVVPWLNAPVATGLFSCWHRWYPALTIMHGQTQRELLPASSSFTAHMWQEKLCAHCWLASLFVCLFGPVSTDFLCHRSLRSQMSRVRKLFQRQQPNAESIQSGSKRELRTRVKILEENLCSNILAVRGRMNSHPLYLH